ENKRTIQKVRLHTGAPLSPHYDHYRSPSHFFASNRCYNISEICPLGFVYFCPIHVLLCSALERQMSRFLPQRPKTFAIYVKINFCNQFQLVHIFYGQYNRITGTELFPVLKGESVMKKKLSLPVQIF